MADLDYDKLGFKSGIEIHQQLEGKKLFCNCPTIISKEKPDFEIVRRLRASAGESGKIDNAALHEQKKQKYFIYQGYDDITCAVELDEEPPHPINQAALKTVLQVAKMLNCRIVDEIQVMRKTVIDGSNTSGFQRTMLIGMDGFVEVNGKKIIIDTICLEEEACQVIERHSDHDVYNLSRLGIPLIEIATGPNMHTPEEVKEVAAKIGMILRSTDNCKRGIGSIRQDVNLSIKRGARVEIKGFQDLRSIVKVINNEIERQTKLLKEGKIFEPEVRNVEDDLTTNYLRPMPGQDRMYPETDIPPIIPQTGNIESVKTIDDRVAELESKYGLSKDMAGKIVRFNISFGEYADKYPNVKPQLIAETFFVKPSEVKKETGKELDIFEHKEELNEIFAKIDSGEIVGSSITPILIELSKGSRPDYSKYKGVSDDELDKEAKKLISVNLDATTGALMGMLMAKYRGKIDGKRAMEILRRNMK